MPVKLPPSQSPEPRPTPPRAVVWLGLLIVAVVIGVVSTLLAWPKNEPTGTALFWICLLVAAPVGWGICFGLRLCYFEQESDRIDADNETLREDRENAVLFASEPLAVVGYTYLSGAGTSNVASSVVEGSISLEAQTSQDGSEGVRHSTLALDVGADSSRYQSCFENLITAIKPVVATIPLDIPFGVRLQLPDAAEQQALLQTWQTCWDDEKMRRARAVLLPAGQGVMALDEWLDNRGGPSLQKCLLIVGVQLHDTPPQNSAEAAVAMVLGWAPLVGRRHIPFVAHLHRPVEANAGSNDAAVSTALLWGRTTGDKVSDLWQAGLAGADKGTVTNSLSDLSVGVSKTDSLSGIHDIDTALGHPGSVAGWLALALAVEHTKQNKHPQLAAWCEGTLRYAVVQPGAQTGNTDSNT
ncbi:hypothetical protein [Paraburkholderia guartelaensis]|uniref:DUF2875 domain-containing protein n=1 Tax=Paraburkholderia guartelaensis TaxID=2546446 RepID=A0ABU9S3H5_9BURK